MKSINFREDIASAGKFISIRTLGLGAALQGAWLFMPDSLRDHLPAHMATWIAYLTYGIAAYGIMVKQAIPTPPPPPKDTL